MDFNLLFIYFITVNKYWFCISVIGYINVQSIGIGYKKINIDRVRHFDHLSSYFTPCAKHLGVIFDCNLGLEKQISAVVKSSFYGVYQE